MALETYVGLDLVKAFSGEHEEGDVLRDLDDTYSNVTFQTKICLPPFSHPAETLAYLKSRGPDGRSLKLDFDKGTTTCAFVYKGGLVVCADSRATGGSFIGSGTVKKIIVVNSYVLGTMAGGAADCSYWLRVLSERCRLYELRNKEPISVAAASKLFSNMLYSYKGMGLSLGVMLMGFDKRGPALYYVDDEGNRLSGQMFSAGSGSPNALGVLDSGYKWDLEDEDAYELGRRAITAATFRDSYSGGIVRCYHLKPDGWVHVGDEDCMVLYEKYNGAPKSTD
ncbi:proteasome subunit beta type-5 [Galendromus occidentalis]|uniref:Proteasome subunit beta n=1 Tax=Galendromus occidentalis TaxID=34638 RepID=A0AAJ6VYG3_9ACAR|nr:proteasome subunit beta type-5 [Galendromus occidentalis]